MAIMLPKRMACRHCGDPFTHKGKSGYYCGSCSNEKSKGERWTPGKVKLMCGANPYKEEIYQIVANILNGNRAYIIQTQEEPYCTLSPSNHTSIIKRMVTTCHLLSSNCKPQDVGKYLDLIITVKDKNEITHSSKIRRIHPKKSTQKRCWI